MQIDVAPETARLVREEILTGHFRSEDEVVRAGVEALRRNGAPNSSQNRTSQETHDQLQKQTGQSLIDACAKVRGLLTDEEVDRLFSRTSSASRPVDFS